MASTSTALSLRFTDGIYEEGLSDVLRGLLYIPRRLSHTWLYDERGGRLFEKIGELPEYYLGRSEMQILQDHGPQIRALLGRDELTVVDYGSGNGEGIRPLLTALPQVRTYVPIDIAASSLARASRSLRRDYPGMTVLPLCADFTHRLELPLQLSRDARRLLCCSASTFGHYEPQQAQRLLAAMRELAGAQGAALIGIDLCAHKHLLEVAHDDAHGLVAQFNLNALRHVNRRLGVGFEISQFRHRAAWVESEQRIEMQLVSAVKQSIRVGAAVIRLMRGDFIRTQCCHSYTPEGFAALAATAGWQLRATWTDSLQRCGVQLLARA